MDGGKIQKKGRKRQQRWGASAAAPSRSRAAAHPEEPDIGGDPGPETRYGNFTSELLEVSMSVIASELDPRMVLELNRRFQRTPH